LVVIFIPLKREEFSAKAIILATFGSMNQKHTSKVRGAGLIINYFYYFDTFEFVQLLEQILTTVNHSNLLTLAVYITLVVYGQGPRGISL
jgi:hypothetical protein